MARVTRIASAAGSPGKTFRLRWNTYRLTAAFWKVSLAFSAWENLMSEREQISNYLSAHS